MSFAPDGRLFVCEQGGKLRVIKNGALLATPFVTLSVNSSGERGLLGVAFDPDFATNGFVYIYYTTSASPVHNRVSRFTASASNPDVAAAGSEVQLLNLPSLSSATNHNGGAIHFGTDGKLYIAVGENANSANSQSLGTTLGKFLRINADGSIPSDNPFVSQTSGINQAIWARGLRNPFNFAIDRSNGRIHLNDVGQDSWEEVNQGVAGSNYGWPQTEGNNPPGVAGVRYPIHTYQNAGTSCAITGAAFYRPVTANFPAEYAGRYFFGDFCGGFIRMLSPPAYSTSAGFATGIDSLVDIQVAPDGSLYYLARGGGDVFRVRFTANSAPSITSQPTNRTVSAGQSASFSVAASGTAPLRYQWQRNGANIASATSPTYTFQTVAADNGATFRAVVSNDFGSATSNAATLTVLTNRAPTGSISSPTAGARYRGGQTFNFAGRDRISKTVRCPPARSRGKWTSITTIICIPSCRRPAVSRAVLSESRTAARLLPMCSTA
jgi:glucose/arabinose dehydrogenase